MESKLRLGAMCLGVKLAKGDIVIVSLNGFRVISAANLHVTKTVFQYSLPEKRGPLWMWAAASHGLRS